MVTSYKMRKKHRFAARAVVFSAAFVFIVAGITMGITSADANSTNNTSFGLYGTSEAVVLEPSNLDTADEAAVVGAAAPSPSSQLSSTTTRDISAGIEEIAAEEEAARVAAEEAARAEESQRIAAAEEAQATSVERFGSSGLSSVDFSVGEEAFIAEWTERIDDYLAGSELSGMGYAFAEAAWKYGVDPRWSPSISNTESTKGQNCFLPCNAWGWGQSSWGDWEQAIFDHVKGLSEVYGYTISYSNAMKYCPPNYDNWYRDTLNEMSKI